MDRRCLFERRDAVADAYGNVTSGGWTTLATVWGAVSDRPGREAREAGRMEAGGLMRLRVRDSATLRGVTAADRVTVDGQVCAIRDVMAPRRTGMIEMVVERGVAP